MAHGEGCRDDHARGYGNLLRGEWGMLIGLSFLVAVALLGIGDGALRPALRRLASGGDGRAVRL